MSRVLLYPLVGLVACCVLAGTVSARDAAEKKDSARPPGKTPEQVFQKLDRNGDGQLDLDELKLTRKKLETAQQAEAFFKRIDKDGNGKVDLGEYVAAKTPRKRAERPVAQKAPQDDLKEIQGTWVRTESSDQSGSQRITKEVDGDTETVTYYDAEGKVQRAHTAKITLRRAGPIRIFMFSDVTYTAGPKEGEKEEESKAYIYKVVDDTFVEIWGVLGEEDSRVHALRWNREKGEQ